MPVKLLKSIPKTMRKMNIPEETISKFSISETNESEDVMDYIKQMDNILSEEQRLMVMQEQGCCKTGIGPRAHHAFGKKHADKTLEEKVDILNKTEMPHRAPCRLNADKTLSVYWGFENEGKYNCVCGIVKKLPKPVDVPLTFCGCCGGHIRNTYQMSLDVKLNLKEIVSSAASSNGKKHCEFLYEIVE